MQYVAPPRRGLGQTPPAPVVVPVEVPKSANPAPTPAASGEPPAAAPAPVPAPKNAVAAQVARQRAAWTGDYRQHQLVSAAEKIERQAKGGRLGPGVLADVVSGDAKKGMVVTVHGGNGSPITMAPFHSEGHADGRAVKTFAHDDMYRPLKKDAKELAGELKSWLGENPGAPLEVDAHCQGARVAVAAMDILAKDGALDGRSVSLNLITPPLQGLHRGDSANFIPPGVKQVMGAVVPLINTGADMSPIGSFQKTLNDARLPDNVKTRIFVADPKVGDGFVNPDHARFKNIAAHLNAEVNVLKGCDHMTSIAAAEALLR